MPFADEGGVVAGCLERFEKGQVVIVPMGQIVFYTVRPGILACQKAGPAGTAQAGGDKRIFKAHTLVAEAVKVGGLHYGVPQGAQCIPPMIVHKDEYDVGSIGWQPSRDQGRHKNNQKCR